MPDSESDFDQAELRAQAEARLEADPPSEVRASSPLSARDVLHELRVHQIELEMQNDELRRAQVEIEQSRSRYFELYELAPIGYLTVGEHGLINELNLAAAGLLGGDRAEIVRQPFSHFIDSRDQDAYYQCRRHLHESSERRVIEFRLRAPATGERWLHAEMVPAEQSDGGAVARIALSDVTARRLAEETLSEYAGKLEAMVEERTSDLSEMNAELLEATAAKSAFLANMSHELRTPLNSIIGFSGILLQELPGPVNEEQRKQLQMVSSSGYQLLALVDDILDLAKIEAKKVDIAQEVFDAGQLLREVAATLEPEAALKDLALNVAVETESTALCSDPGKVRQVLLNLAGNAVKFTDRGQVDLTFERSDNGRGVFTISDTGHGIAPHDLARVFDAFVQIDPLDVMKPKGTGLGVTLARNYARLLGGDISVVSTLGEGSAFTFVVPDARDA